MAQGSATQVEAGLGFGAGSRAIEAYLGLAEGPRRLVGELIALLAAPSADRKRR